MRQLRVSMAGPIGLDFGAVLAMGHALGADGRMLAELLPTMECAALERFSGDTDEGAGDEN